MCGVCATLVAQLVLGGTSTTSHKCTAGIITRTRIPARTHNTNTVSCLRDMFSRLGKAMMTGQHVKVFCGVGDFVSSDRKTSFEFDRSRPPSLPPSSTLLLSLPPSFFSPAVPASLLSSLSLPHSRARALSLFRFISPCLARLLALPLPPSLPLPSFLLISITIRIVLLPCFDDTTHVSSLSFFLAFSPILACSLFYLSLSLFLSLSRSLSLSLSISFSLCLSLSYI